MVESLEGLWRCVEFSVALVILAVHVVRIYLTRTTLVCVNAIS